MISIIIPVFNEADTINHLLGYLTENSSLHNITEIIICDGGSNDGTQQIVTAFSLNAPFKIDLISSTKGRAKQMNVGAKNANGRILYFLHADSIPPKNFDRSIIFEINKGNTAGCFRMKFDSKHPILKLSQWFTKFNIKICRGGDQSLFISKHQFGLLGGFNENYIVFEDCEFINRLYDQGGFTIIPQHIITSARKYHQIGTVKLQYHFAMMHIHYWMGVRYEGLHRYYQKHISRN